jgi:hypothetical protein
MGSDSELNMSALFELHFVAMLIKKRVFYSEPSVRAVGRVNTDLGFLGLVRTPGWNDPVDGARQADAGL